MYSKEFDDIPITFFKSKRAKRIIIRVKPIKGVRVSVPLFASYNSAENFVLSRLNWIKENQTKCLAQQKDNKVFYIGETFTTKKHCISFLSHNEPETKTTKELNKVAIFIPSRVDIKNHAIQKKIREEIVEIWRIEAKEYLPIRLAQLANINGLIYNKVTIRNTKTRWGSCSHVNNINLSLHLMRLPENLIDYVLLHELAHIKVKNHSKYFWGYLESICKNSKALDVQLKKYNTQFL